MEIEDTDVLNLKTNLISEDNRISENARTINTYISKNTIYNSNKVKAANNENEINNEFNSDINDQNRHVESLLTNLKNNPKSFNFEEKINLNTELEKLHYQIEKINEEKKVIFDQGLKLESEKHEINSQVRFFENYLIMLDQKAKILERNIGLDSNDINNNSNKKKLKNYSFEQIDIINQNKLLKSKNNSKIANTNKNSNQNINNHLNSNNIIDNNNNNSTYNNTEYKANHGNYVNYNVNFALNNWKSERDSDIELIEGLKRRK